MKVTTVRFGTDLWALLEHEAASAGVSTSQYIREAALARAAAAAAGRGEDPLELLAGLGDTQARQRGAKSRGEARHDASDQTSDYEALAAQREQAFRHARSVITQSELTVQRAQEQRSARD